MSKPPPGIAEHQLAEDRAWKESIAGKLPKTELKLTAMQHFEAWWAEIKAELPERHHRDPVEYFEEQFARLQKRLR